MTATFGKWTVKRLFKGDKYGLDNCRTWPHDEPGIEFYTDSGQFVTRYNEGNILKLTTGLCLYASVPHWQADEQTIADIQAWIRGEHSMNYLNSVLIEATVATEVEPSTIVDKAYTFTVKSTNMGSDVTIRIYTNGHPLTNCEVDLNSEYRIVGSLLNVNDELCLKLEHIEKLRKKGKN